MRLCEVIVQLIVVAGGIYIIKARDYRLGCSDKLKELKFPSVSAKRGRIIYPATDDCNEFLVVSFHQTL